MSSWISTIAPTSTPHTKVGPEKAGTFRIDEFAAGGQGARLATEGVEDAATANWLRDHGCDIGQGYYFGKPVAADKVLELIEVAVEPAPESRAATARAEAGR